ncbi:interleukin-13 receptor subunit alpha-2-like isoform X1 [Lates japonicus]|uniref:Interleukin-13 receptor subunit alpha-2-like isoform X1 n=1 Tax=Lates japonicus TaxID=270547 RepID=A0AAD3QWF2_LATJO|nr:interleukin-13 receptor subunit alpha-2-like isoform X1 [Lates japonicus]
MVQLGRTQRYQPPQRNLYFWHRELEQAEECPKYIFSGGVRSGCDFTGKALPDFTDINFYINGSSPQGPLKPTYASLQIQNHVKPGTAEKLHLQTGPDMHLEIQWERPVGSVPGQCLEWEVEYSQEGPDGKITSQQIFTEEMNLTLPLNDDYRKSCVRVRSKLHKYCVNKGLWSEWSHPACHPEMKEVAPEPQWDMVPVYVYIATAIIAILVLSLCVGTVLKVFSIHRTGVYWDPGDCWAAQADSGGESADPGLQRTSTTEDHIRSWTASGNKVSGAHVCLCPPGSAEEVIPPSMKIVAPQPSPCSPS